MAGKDNLNPTKSPALPFAPVQYDRGYQDTNNNVLRQYFNTLDNVTNSLLNSAGGRFLTFPHIAAQDSTDQYATGDNVATKVRWNTLDSGLAFTLNPNNSATPEFRGVYKIDYSLQVFNTAPQIHEIYVWLRLNGDNIAGTGHVFSVPERHGGVDGSVVVTASETILVSQIDEISLFWATDKAATSGGVTGVYLHAAPAQTTPFVMPSIPSVTGTFTFVSGVVP